MLFLLALAVGVDVFGKRGDVVGGGFVRFGEWEGVEASSFIVTGSVFKSSADL